MQEGTLTHINVVYSNARKKVSEYHFVGGTTRPPSPKVIRDFDRDAFMVLVEDYWTFIGRRIREGALDAREENTRTNFIGELEAWGQQMSDCLFSPEAQKEIWSVASQSDIVLLDTNLDEVPWEALFCADVGNSGEFLSENCVLQRQIYGGEFEALPVPCHGKGSFICVDPELLREEAEKGVDLAIELKKSRSVYYETTNSKDLSEKVKSGQVVHWICEHINEKGLRLGPNTYYTEKDIRTHRFPSKSAVFLLSCSAARTGGDTPSFSSKVATSSKCTVIAPSSVVAASEAVRFVSAVEDVLNKTDLSRLSDVWSSIKGPLGGRASKSDGISVDDCYLLWFGIYGDCNVSLREALQNGS